MHHYVNLAARVARTSCMQNTALIVEKPSGSFLLLVGKAVPNVDTEPIRFIEHILNIFVIRPLHFACGLCKKCFMQEGRFIYACIPGIDSMRSM